MDAYVVIGSQHSYKSSVVRSLSGSRVSGVRFYALHSKKVAPVYVRLSSLQEGDGLNPEDFLRLVEKSGAEATLFALRPTGRGRFPDADAYLGYFIGKGWNIKRVAVMGASASPLHTTNLSEKAISCFPLRAQPIAVNLVAADVRAHFGWP